MKIYFGDYAKKKYTRVKYERQNTLGFVLQSVEQTPKGAVFGGIVEIFEGKSARDAKIRKKMLANVGLLLPCEHSERMHWR